jgi:hypothetical protein
MRMKCRHLSRSGILFAAVSLLTIAAVVRPAALNAQTAENAPLSVGDVRRLLGTASPSSILTQARARCLAFPVYVEASGLRGAGASDQLLEGLRLVCRGTADGPGPIVRTSSQLRQAAEAQLPKPNLPVMPKPPRAPSPAVAAVSGLVVGGLGVAAGASACTSTATAPSPYGGFVGDRYYAPGTKATSKSAGCPVLIGSSLGAASSALSWILLKGKYRQADAAYQVATKRYPTDSAAAVRALAQWRTDVDQLVVTMAAGDERQGREARDGAARLDTLIRALRGEELRVAAAKDSARRADSLQAVEARRLASDRRADSVRAAEAIRQRDMARRADSVRLADATRERDAARRADSLRLADATRERDAARRADSVRNAEAERVEADRLRRLESGELLPPRVRFSNPSAVAVVIGNQNYARKDLVPSVDYAKRDADAMRRFLVESFGFLEDNIIVAPDASLGTFQSIFGSSENYRGLLFNRMDPRPGTSDVFVFYSGHGAPDPNTGKTFLVPSDVNPQNLALTSYSTRTLYENLNKLSARSVTVVVDACFSGLTFKGAPLLRQISPVGVKAEVPLVSALNFTVLTAAQSNEVSGWYEQRQHGLFTYVLLQQMQRSLDAGSGQVVPSAKQLVDQVSFEVLRLSRRLGNRDQNPAVFGGGQAQPLAFLRR